MAKIDDDHMYYGAALLQIAEHPQYTSINTYKRGEKPVRCCYVVNDEAGLYVKYRSKQQGAFRYKTTNGERPGNEYHFVFDRKSRNTIDEMVQQRPSLFLALVCVEDRQICCISYEEFRNLVDKRHELLGGQESAQVAIYVAKIENSGFQVFVPTPKKRGSMNATTRVPQNAFPKKVFT